MEGVRLWRDGSRMDHPYWIAKGCTALGLWILTELSAHAPWWLANSKYFEAFLSYGNCLAGGVVFGAMMLHVLPNICVSSSATHPYPTGLFFASISFLVLFAVDRLFLHDPEHRNPYDSVPAEDPLRSEEAGTTRSSSSGAFVFVLALSLHSFLEGLGLAGMSTYSEVASYIIGLVSHKWLEAFALGLSVYQARISPSTQSILVHIYSSLTPLGILLGIFLIGTRPIHSAATQILTGLSVGSFLYVSCIEMIPPSFENVRVASVLWTRFACVLAGFFAMAAFAWLDVTK